MKLRTIFSSLAMAFGATAFAHAECPKVTPAVAKGPASYAVSGTVFLGDESSPVTKFDMGVSENQAVPFQMEEEVTYLRDAEHQQNQDGSPRVLLLKPETFTVGVNAVFGITGTADKPMLSFCVRHAQLDRLDQVKSASGYTIQMPLITQRELSKTGVPVALGQEQVFEGDGWRVKLRVNSPSSKSST